MKLFKALKATIYVCFRRWLTVRLSVTINR